jgi:peptidoglycan/LPS O-acetylase OafA/YrhL
VPPHHDERLQSLRGLAALLVIVGHGLIVLPQTPGMFVMSGIFQADAAVVFFYVLSGFVLGESLKRDARFLPFVVRRLARLLPVLWASLAVALVVSVIVAGPSFDGATDWYNVYRSIDTSPHAVMLNGLALSWRINSVMWSVQIELFVIPLLPVAVLATRRLRPWQALLVLLALCTLAARLLNGGDARPLAYLYCFYLGMLIPAAMRTPALRPFFSPLMVAASLGITFVFGEIRLCPSAKHLIDALVSAQLLACVLRSPSAAPFLRHRWFVVLGDVSYSLYAFGQVALIFVAFAMFTLLPPSTWSDYPTAFSLSLIALTVAIVLPIAALSYRWIELPGMAFAKFILARQAAPIATGPIPRAG